MRTASSVSILALMLCAACAQERHITAGDAGADAASADGATADAGAPDAGAPDGGVARDYPYHESTGDELKLVNAGYTVVVNLKTGYFDVLRGAETAVRRARSELKTADDTVMSTATKGMARTFAVEGGGGAPLTATVTSAGTGLPTILQAFALEKGSPAFTLDVTVVNATGATLVVKKILPAVARDAAGGALFVGTDPAHHRILENGSDAYLDFYARLLTGDAPRGGMSDLFPWEAEGSSVSNLDHAIYDLDAKRPFVAGFLGATRMVPFATVGYDAAKARTDEATGRKGFTHWGLECPYIPVNQELDAGASLAAETAYVDAASADPLDALERYAGAIAKKLQITLWTARTEQATGKPYRVPSGWNSWSGSGSTGGYGSTINEGLIDTNLDFMARELEPFGVDWFQMDDGWQIGYGDWTLNKDRFPDHGVEDSFTVLNRKTVGLGMKPGLWIAAFTAHEQSATYKAHPDWFAMKDSFGTISAGGDLVYDFTLPGPLQFIEETFTRLNDWGFRWTKLDFAYWTMAVQKLAEKNATPIEAYRRGLKKIRETVGPDHHLLTVSAIGPSLGLADSNRLTLDNMPVWDGTKSIDDFSDQGLKPTYRTVARRYFLSHKVWLNHPDLIFFRPNEEPGVKPITLDEARAFCSTVALTGGIVKIGERLVEMKPAWVDTVRRLLPAYPATGRPLDLFTREFPELWHLPLKDAPGGGYDVVGVINWGINKDLTKNPYELMPDAARTVTVPLGDLGLDPQATYLAYEFWDERFIGEVTGSLAVEAAAHRAYLVALRKKEPRPQFLGTNRHALMGVVGVGAVAWDDAAKTLTVTQEATPGTAFAPFEYRVAFSVPAGWTVKDHAVSGVDASDVALTTDGGRGTLAFTANEKGEATWTVTFNAP